jgi:hypothetical protein
MSEYPIDKKEDLFIAQLSEPDVELVVGAPARRQCFWSRFRGCQNHHACAAGSERKQRSPLRRAIRWFLTVFLLLGVTGFFVAKHHIHRQIKAHPIICTPVTDLSNTTLTLPLHSWKTKLVLHPSLTGGDVKITHSEEVEKGTVQISFALPEKTELRTIDEDENPKVFACRMIGPRFVGAGVHGNPHKKHHDGDDKEIRLTHHKEHKDGEHKKWHHKGPKAYSTIVTLPAEEAGKARPISLLGWFPRRHFGHKCMKRRIRKAIIKAIKAARAEKLIKLEHVEDDE